MDDYTPAQKAKIARHFVLVAPHGESKEVVKDLKEVISPNIASEQWQREALSEYSKRRFEIIYGDTTKVVCCPQGEVAPNKFLNPQKNVVCEVDPMTKKIVATNEADQSILSGKYDPFRKALQERLDKYLGAYYEDGTTPNSYAKGVGSVFVSPEGKVAVVISFKNLNQANYWTGGWQSEWTFSLASSGKIEGRIRLNVHYYEDGNVQLNCTLNESGNVTVNNNPNTTAENVVKVLQQLESNFQKRLDNFYVQMNKSTFKNMRRLLPKTATKMDWKASVHQLVQEATAAN